MPKTRPTPKRREIIFLYRNGELTKPVVMKKLGLGQNYHQFNALYHNCTQEDFKE